MTREEKLAKRHPKCPKCRAQAKRDGKHDAYGCDACNIWIEAACDDPSCAFCTDRPAVPFCTWTGLGSRKGWTCTARAEGKGKDRCVEHARVEKP